MVPGPLSRAAGRLARRPRATPDATLAALGVAALTAGVVAVLAIGLFPHHTTNHDEGVYLQQAAMLLEGQLVLRPPVPEAMRPWFFVAEGGRLYPKYAPVPAAIFALGEAVVGRYRAALPVMAAASVWLTYRLGAAAADRRTGLAAAGLLAASPLFLVQSAVFLPYAPTFALELGFAVAYVRAVRRRSRRWGALAGAAIGLAFFARPWTAVLFAAPFVAHAAWLLRPSRRAGRRTTSPLLATAGAGLAFVGLALAYNAALTGDPTTFPYEAFAPRDGLGFGERAILGHERTYTPWLAVRATAANLAVLATTWAPAGPLGVLLATLGVGLGLRSPADLDAAGGPDVPDAALTDRQLRWLVLGVVATVVAGNAAFWGILNVLGRLDAPGDGLVRFLGPYYHVDLLLPLAVFGGVGLVAVHDRLTAAVADPAPVPATADRPATAVDRRRLAVAAALAVVVVAASGAVAARPLSDAAVATDSLDDAYAPFEDRDLDAAVVLLPTPYGPWLNHPFQALRNDPGYDDGPVYAVDDGPTSLDVLAAFPDREAYRYAYRGPWAPHLGAHVDARLQPVSRGTGETVVLSVRLGVPDGVSSGSMRVAGREDVAYAGVDVDRGTVTFDLRLRQEGAHVAGLGVRPTGDGRLAIASRDELVVEVFLEGEGTALSYRLRLPVVVEDGTVHTATPAVEACRWPRLCGGESAYLPDDAATGVLVETTLATDGGSA